MAAALRKNPDYHGFDLDPVWDARTMHMCFFFGISLCIVVGSFFLRYLPENNMRSWARREAEQRVKERERLGLPALDSNYFDPSKLVLPPEDEDEDPCCPQSGEENPVVLARSPAPFCRPISRSPSALWRSLCSSRFQAW
uniref:NADH dehydrogenase [ubiquinone] 1 beta subcomplex subunit 11, mitochondrial n=1 Tax=Pelusios castaneus TaxID=367368 RepID=A0A8C8REG3_9SAUR